MELAWNRRIFAQKRNDGNNTELFIRSAEITGRIRLADLRHEDDERGSAEDSRTAVAVCFVEDDNKQIHWDVDGYDGDLRCAVVIGYNGDDRLVRFGGIIDAGTGHQHHHGSEHRYDANGVDHVAWL